MDRELASLKMVTSIRASCDTAFFTEKGPSSGRMALSTRANSVKTKSLAKATIPGLTAARTKD
jgi:hypothetical protein